jgi:hypothetical protein
LVSKQNWLLVSWPRLPKNTRLPLLSTHFISYLPITEEKLKEIQSCTANDSTLQHLQRVVLNGCPEDKNLLPNDVMPYYQYREELSVVDGLVFKGERLIIPSSMWKEIKEKIHQGHMGIEKCKVRARGI